MPTRFNEEVLSRLKKMGLSRFYVDSEYPWRKEIRDEIFPILIERGLTSKVIADLLDVSQATVYKRLAKFGLRAKRKKRSTRLPAIYPRVKSLLDTGLNQTQVAKELGRTRQYVSLHPPKPCFPASEETQRECLRLLREGNTRQQIVSHTGYPFSYVSQITRKHQRGPSLPPIYAWMKTLLDRGLNQTQVAKELGCTRQYVNWMVKRNSSIME